MLVIRKSGWNWGPSWLAGVIFDQEVNDLNHLWELLGPKKLWCAHQKPEPRKYSPTGYRHWWLKRPGFLACLAWGICGRTNGATKDTGYWDCSLKWNENASSHLGWGPCATTCCVGLISKSKYFTLKWLSAIVSCEVENSLKVYLEVSCTPFKLQLKPPLTIPIPYYTSS